MYPTRRAAVVSGDRHGPDPSGLTVFDAHNHHLLVFLSACLFFSRPPKTPRPPQRDRITDPVPSRCPTYHEAYAAGMMPCFALCPGRGPAARWICPLDAWLRDTWLWPISDTGAFHDGPGLDAKVPLARGAIVRHVRVLRNAGTVMPTMGAHTAVLPYATPEPLHGGLFVGEHLEQLFQRKALLQTFRNRLCLATCPCQYSIKLVFKDWIAL